MSIDGKLISPSHSQDLDSNPSHCLRYFSVNVSSENLVVN